jgi:hypothetical protein
VRLNSSRNSLFCILVALCLLCISPPAFAKGELSAKQARKLIANIPGFSLKTSTVRVNSMRPIDAATFEANAEIVTAFRLEKNANAQWRVIEFRSGQDQWQSVEFITRALRVEPDASSCDAPELAATAKTFTDPSIRRARCLLGDLLGVKLPSDAIRIKAVSPMTLPFSSKPSALIEALVAAEFRFQKTTKGAWRVAGLRSGNRDWVDPELISRAVDNEKAAGARADLESIAKALEDFRSRRGFYIESKSEAVLIDFLSPRYLSSVIRLDPWRRPYLYEGTRDRFTLRSLGPDGKENTSDDIVLNNPARSAAFQDIPD